MPTRPPELEFATADGREATPERMNRAMDYILGRLKAAESVVPEFESALNQLEATGLTRLNEFLTPLFNEATAMRDAIEVIKLGLEETAWRTALIADVKAAVIADIEAANLYVKAGAGATDATLYAGAGTPDNALGQDGDLYVKGG